MQTRPRIKDLELTMDVHRVDDRDLLMVFDFFTLIVEECDSLSMSEPKPSWCSPNS